MTAKKVDTAIGRAIGLPEEKHVDRVGQLRRYTASLAFALWFALHLAVQVTWIPRPDNLLDAGLFLVPLVYAAAAFVPDLLTWVVRIRGGGQ